MFNKPWENGPLTVSEDKRFMQNGDKPFFWLGDTAWLMFCTLTREEIDAYLRNRAEKGYNVIQITLAHKWPVTTADGIDAFLDEDFTKPNTQKGGFWDLVDYTLRRAEYYGLYLGLLPIWSGQFKAKRITEDNVEDYIQFLTDRFGKKYPNIIWITGGDCKGTDGFDFWSKMGRKLKAENPDKLCTFHPFGRTVTCDYFPDSEWIDFYMFQSGHRRYDQKSLKKWDDSMTMGYFYGEDTYKYIERVQNCGNPKPVLDGEPSYEHIPHGLHDPSQPFWQDYDVRRFAYWSVLAGACGFTFGHSSIMQFYEGDGTEPGAYGCTINWKDAVHSPASDNMSKMAALMRSVDFEKGHAAQNILAYKEGLRYNRISAFAGEDFALFYDYTGRKIEIKANAIAGEYIDAWWFDPVSGTESYIGKFKQDKILTFTPPVGTFTHQDWVLKIKTAQ